MLAGEVRYETHHTPLTMMSLLGWPDGSVTSHGMGPTHTHTPDPPLHCLPPPPQHPYPPSVGTSMAGSDWLVPLRPSLPWSMGNKICRNLVHAGMGGELGGQERHTTHHQGDHTHTPDPPPHYTIYHLLYNLPTHHRSPHPWQPANLMLQSDWSVPPETLSTMVHG